jgi:tetratricopeptide (TPR) repeat protein
MSVSAAAGSARHRGGAAAAVIVLLLPWSLMSCASPEAEPAATDERKARVVEFWRLYHEASASRARGDAAAAAASYEGALRLDPDHEDSLYHLGQILQERGRMAEALASFRRLVQVNDNSARGHLALGALLASVAEDGPWDLERAEHHLRRAHEINGEETGPMMRLGEVRLLRRDAADAEHWLNAAAATNPKSVEAAFLSGYLRWKAGDVQAAREWYERALKASRTEAPIKGVLNEGDRKAAPATTAPAGASAQAEPARVAAPPLASPMGRTLFDELCRRLGTLDPDAAYGEADRRAARLAGRPPRPI